MSFLNRDQLLKREKLTVEKVEFDNGDHIFVRAMYGGERDAFEASLLRETTDTKGDIAYKYASEDFRAKLAVHTVCNEEGKNIFKPNDTITISKNMSAARLDLIVEVAQRLSKITEKDKEALVKNLEGGQSGDSTSGSA